MRKNHSQRSAFTYLHKLEVVNSSPSRTTTVQQTSNSKFHLPELKVGRQQQQQQQQQQTSGVGGGVSDAINSYDRKEQQKQPNPVDDAIARIDDAIAAAINGGGGSDEAMVRNGRLSATSSGSFSLSNDDFVRRLVEVVRREPALYDPSHEHYGNKHASAHFRSAIWQRLCKELDYPEDPHLLQMQWKRIREKYIRERRRRRGAVAETDSSSLNNLNAAARNFSAMGWLDDYLGDNANVTRLNTAGPSTSGESYHEPTNHMNGGMVLKDVAGQQNRLALGGKGTAGPHMAKTAKKHTESTNGSSPSSTSSEISVGSAAAAASAIAPFGTSGGQQQQHSTAILLPQLRHLPNNGNSNNFSLNTSAFNGTTSTGGAGVGRLRGRHSHHAQIGHFGRQQPQQMEEELTGQQALQQHDVIGAATGVAPTGGLSMVPDGPSSSSAYQIISVPHDGTQQHSMATMGIEQQQPSGSGTSNFFQPIQSSTSTAQHLPSTTTSIRGRKRPAALEVGQQQLQQTNRAHLFIDQAGDRIVLNQPTAVVQAPMLVQHQSPILQNSSPHSMHINPAALANHASRSCSSATFRVGHIGREQSTSTAGQQQQQQQMPASLMAQPQYILSTASQQSHLYDVESAMIEMIVRHLGNLNDDEKVVTKMNIQRILMDARFGRGACVRMFREEEQSELSLEQQQRHMQQQQQQQQQNSFGSSQQHHRLLSVDQSSVQMPWRFLGIQPDYGTIVEREWKPSLLRLVRDHFHTEETGTSGRSEICVQHLHGFRAPLLVSQRRMGKPAYYSMELCYVLDCQRVKAGTQTEMIDVTAVGPTVLKVRNERVKGALQLVNNDYLTKASCDSRTLRCTSTSVRFSAPKWFQVEDIMKIIKIFSWHQNVKSSKDGSFQWQTTDALESWQGAIRYDLTHLREAMAVSNMRLTHSIRYKSYSFRCREANCQFRMKAVREGASYHLLYAHQFQHNH
uniref:MADF domain-containing protein n=1 Tax=Globodera rostochiensis TaxID=31243 RepID=A0A914GX13_GLORO